MSREFCEIVEVSPRDGIQNEQCILSTDAKLKLIDMAMDAGIVRLEVTSFVNPKRVPQMADADAVAAQLANRSAGRFIGLVVNKRGIERAAAAGIREVNFVVVASDSFNRRNQGVGTMESVATFTDIRQAMPDVAIGLTIGAAFGCPFEGEVPLARLMDVVEACMEHQPSELTLADTIGVAVPRAVTERIGAVRRAFPDVPLRLHLHNTRNTGIANAWAGLEAGVRSLDASLGGAGGCPFAPRATGNIATEDLVYMLDRSGVQTNISLDKAIAAATWLEERLGKTVPGMVMKAGGFPGRMEPDGR